MISVLTFMNITNLY